MSSIFNDTSDTEQRGVFARRNLRGYGYGAGTPGLLMLLGGWSQENRAPAISIGTADVTRDPLLMSAVETAVCQIVGDAFVPTSQVDADLLGLSKQEKRRIDSIYETNWKAFRNTADFVGLESMQGILSQVVRSMMLFGEAVAILEYRRKPGQKLATRIKLLCPTQIDTTRTIWSGTERTVNGLSFSPSGEWTGLWIRDVPLGAQTVAPIPKFISRYTRHGRPRLVWISNRIEPRAIRGLPVVSAALTSASERAAFAETQLEAATLANSYAATLESQLPPAAAIGGIMAPSIPNEGAGVDGLDDMRASFYEQHGPFAQSKAKIAVLPQGDALHINRVDSPGANSQAFHGQLVHSIAAATGQSYADISSDYSNMSFSAARFAQDLPWKHVLRRRKDWVARFLQPIWECVCEELHVMGEVPYSGKDTPGFYLAKAAWTNVIWNSSPKPIANPKQEMDAIAAKMSLGLLSWTQALAELGLDAEKQAIEIQQDKVLLESLGLTLPVFASESKQQIRISDDMTDDEPPARDSKPPKDNQRKRVPQTVDDDEEDEDEELF